MRDRSKPRKPRGAKAAAFYEDLAVVRDATRVGLICQIENAFDGVALGGGVSLTQARAMDDYESDEAIAAARSFDTEARWEDIADEKVERLFDALPFLDAEGFRFYIPRFMVYALRHHGKSDSSATDWAIASADTPRSPQHALLSPQQREAVRAFAEYFRDESNASGF